MENQAQPLEQTLINIVRTLPPERISELVDFARYLQALAIRAREIEPLTESAGDKMWDELLVRADSQELLLEMAREARAEYYAGRAAEIDITADGRLAPK